MLDTDTLLAGSSIAPLIVFVVQLVKGLTPLQWQRFWAVNERQIVLTFGAGAAIMLCALWLGYLPAWVSWRDALRASLPASLQAIGEYHVLKGTISKLSAKLRTT